MTQSAALFWRAVAAFVALPLTVGFLVPWLLRPDHPLYAIVGIPLLAIGVVMLLWCVYAFYVSGHGTLAPWSPPKDLVTIGLYRVSRNPMYVAVLIILCGWATLFQSRTLWIYALIVAVAFHLRIVFYEEPWLARTHGETWSAYRARVPRWFGPRVRDRSAV